MQVRTVSISVIRQTQEVSRLDPVIVGRAMDLLYGGWDLKRVPPLKGYFYGDEVEMSYFYGDEVEMTDGHHRYAAAVALGYDNVPVLNEAAMRRGDKSAYSAAVRKYRKLIGHPLSKMKSV